MKILLFTLILLPNLAAMAEEDVRDYLDCTIKRKAQFKEEKKKKFHINFVLKIPQKDNLDLEKVKLDMDKEWISTNVTLDYQGQLVWKIKEEGFPVPHPEVRKKLENFNPKNAFPIEEDLTRTIDSTKSIVYRLRCR